MATKKAWHTKSREGCFRCRQRRIKASKHPIHRKSLHDQHADAETVRQCDSRKPVCRNCVRQALHCIFPSGATSAESGLKHHDALVIQQPFASTQAGLATGMAPSLSSYEVFLLHHFCVTTGNTIMMGAMYTKWVQDVVPSYLVFSRYSVTALLSIAAIHLAFLKPDEKQHFSAIAYQYRNESLAGVQSALSRLDAYSQEFSSLWLTVVCHSCFALALPGDDAGDRKTDAVSLFRFYTSGWKYPGIVNHAFQSYKFSIETQPCFFPYPSCHREPLSGSVNLEIDEAIDALEAIVAGRLTTGGDEWTGRRVRSLLDFAQQLRPRYAQFAQTTSYRFINFYRFDFTELYEMLEERDPVAEACVMCYGALLHMVDSQWFVNGFGRELVLAMVSKVRKLGEKGELLSSWALNWAGQSSDTWKE